MSRHVWVIERSSDGRKWEPCACAHITKKDACREKTFYWEYNHPEYRYTVVKYVSKTK